MNFELSDLRTWPAPEGWKKRANKLAEDARWAIRALDDLWWAICRAICEDSFDGYLAALKNFPQVEREER